MYFIIEFSCSEIVSLGKFLVNDKMRMGEPSLPKTIFCMVVALHTGALNNYIIQPKYIHTYCNYNAIQILAALWGVKHCACRPYNTTDYIVDCLVYIIYDNMNCIYVVHSKCTINNSHVYTFLIYSGISLILCILLSSF